MNKIKKYELKCLKCLICNDDKEYDRLHSHLYFNHNLKSEEYTLKYLYNNIHPLCACGCGVATRYEQFSFALYCHGHNANRKGIEPSKEHKDKLSESNKKWAIEHPEEVKEKVERIQAVCQTPEAKKRRTDSRWSKEENHKKQSEVLTKRYIDHPELKQQISQKVKQYRSSLSQEEKDEIYNEKWREKISQSISQKFIDGGFEWSRGNYYSTKMNENFYYRSSWELEYMKYLDGEIDVFRWSYEPFWIKYKKNNTNHRYIPDFLVEYMGGKIEIHEIGVKVLKDIQSQKIEAIKNYCLQKQWKFKIIDENYFTNI